MFTKRWFRKSVIVRPGCWPYSGRIDDRGYGRSGATLFGRRIFRAHQQSFVRSRGRLPADGMVIMHKCDNPACVRPTHLTEGTQLDNIKDMVIKGRASRRPGELHPKSKLHTWEVSIIKALRSDSVPQRRLAKVFSVCPATISHIWTGRLWPHVA